MGGKTELSLEDRGEREEQEMLGDMKKVVVASDRAGASHGSISFILHVPKDRQSAPHEQRQDTGIWGPWTFPSVAGVEIAHKGRSVCIKGLQ